MLLVAYDIGIYNDETKYTKIYVFVIIEKYVKYYQIKGFLSVLLSYLICIHGYPIPI